MISVTGTLVLFPFYILETVFWRGFVPSAQALETAKASRDRAKASVESAKAQVEQARAQLAVNRTELAKAEVISPVRGMVLSRLVDPGQTVAATLQTPELFVIAEDLKEMEPLICRTKMK